MKKLFATMLSIALLTSLLPATCFADETYNAVKAESSSAVAAVSKDAGSNKESASSAMEKALLAVKGKIAISKEYTEFNYYYYDTSPYSEAYWRFNWTSSDGKSRIYVNCDTDHHIMYYYKYSYSEGNPGIARYLKSELKSTADDFIRRIAPELNLKYEYLGAEYDSVYSGNYVYKYQRKEKSVALPDNTIQVSVNSVSGEVTQAQINWLYDKSVPSSSAKITKEEAAAAIKENMKMKLAYKSDYMVIYDKNGNRKKKAYLVYEPSLDYISVDAKTGKVYLDSSEWVSSVDMNNMYKEEAKSYDTAAGSSSVSLTDSEIARIQELNKLITKEKAIETVKSNKSLYLEDTLTSITASLSKLDTDGEESSYVWYISMSDPRKIDYSRNDEDNYRAYAYAAVDAKSGKIVSFSSSVRSMYNQKEQKWEKADIKYNKEEARKILEKFLKNQISNKFGNSVLANSYDDYVLYYNEANKPVYGGYCFVYNRTNEGIEYPYNSIYGSVDGVTGKIYSFYYNWDANIEFESAEGAISPDKAMDYYLGNDGFGLKYEINTINKYSESKEAASGNPSYTVDYEIRLVYRPDIEPKYISPFTGEQLNYNGQVYKEKAPYTYTDITDPVLYRNIFLLADMGLGFEGDSFLPDKAITVGELNKLLSDIGGYGSSETDEKDDNTITREKAAMTFITKLGLERVAKLSGIYKTGYNDEASISTEYIGAVALSKALALMNGDSDNNFNPKKEITRLDAVNLVINYLNLNKSGFYY